MGFIKLLTNPMGAMMDKFQERRDDAFDFSDILKPGGVSDVIQSKVTSPLQEKIGGLQDQIKTQMERAGGGETAEQIQEQIAKIQGRELPEVDPYKPAGKAAEWLNRLGAGLYAAGGGNPEDIYRNFRMKEEAKAARHQRQVELRTQAETAQDADVLGALDSIFRTESASGTSLAGNLISQATQLESAAAQATSQAIEQEGQNARLDVQIQASFDEINQRHQNRMAELDLQGELSIEQIEESAALQIRTETNEELSRLGLNPASFESMVNAYSRGGLAAMDQADQVRLREFTRLRAAQTDEELRTAKIDSVARLLGVRVQATDKWTGEKLYNEVTGEPIMTTLSTSGEALSFMYGSEDAGLDALANNDVEGLKRFVESSTAVQPTQMMTGGRSPIPPSARQGQSADTGFATTGDAIAEPLEMDPRTLESQRRNQGKILNAAIEAMERGNSLYDELLGMTKAGIAPEIQQAVLQRALEAGYWDGQEQRNEIHYLLETGQPFPAGRPE
jgi:hypothetical protein